MALALVIATCTGAAPPRLFDRSPPGTIVQDIAAHLSRGANNPVWRVVTSRTIVGRMGDEPAYQWYISFYAPAPRGYRLAYQLPNASGMLLSRVRKVHGAALYFPHQDVRIAGTGDLEGSGAEDVVIASKESAADCGAADVTVFGASRASHVEQRVHVSNSCDLQAAIVTHAARSSVRLSGPYYDRNAALCCPTKPDAQAMLAYRHGDWSVTPGYYIISASLAAHHPQ